MSLAERSSRAAHEEVVKRLWNQNGAEYARRILFGENHASSPTFLEFAAVFEAAIPKHGLLPCDPHHWHTAESAGVAALFFEARAFGHLDKGEGHKAFADLAIAGHLRQLSHEAIPVQRVQTLRKRIESLCGKVHIFAGQTGSNRDDGNRAMSSVAHGC